MQYFRGCPFTIARRRLKYEERARRGWDWTAFRMLVMVKCVIFDGQRAATMDDDTARRISHVHEGQVVAAWRAVDGRVGFALLNVASMAVISPLLHAAFPGARHVDVEEVLAVESVGDIEYLPGQATPGAQRKTGS
jgi:hypothetical protein